MRRKGKASLLLEKQRHSAGALFGLVAGCVFALIAWGVDGALLWSFSSSLPWLKFFAGLPLCLGGGALVGWLTARLNRYWAAILLWFAAGSSIAWMGLRLPFEGLSLIHGLLTPAFRNSEVYPFVSDLLPVGIWVVLGVGLAFSLVGLLEVNFLQSCLGRKMTTRGWMIPLVAALLIVASGVVFDGTIHRSLREPIASVDQGLRAWLRQDRASGAQSPTSSSDLSAFQPLEQYIHQNYRLALGAVNPKAIHQSVVIVNWEDVWGNCFIEGSEITSCQLSIDRYVKPLICILAGGMQHECGIQVAPMALEQIQMIIDRIKGTDVSFEIFSQQGAVVLVRVLSDNSAEYLCLMGEQARITLQRCMTRR